MKSMMNRAKIKRALLDVVYDIAGSILYAVGIYTFARMGNFAPGGLSGLALIINHVSALPIGTVTLILNIPFVIFSYKFVGKYFLMKTVRTMLLNTIILDVIFPYTTPYTGSPILAALYAGMFLGAGLTLFYMRGTSSGGTDFLIMTVKALKPHVSIGVVTMMIDLVIIGLGGLVFGNVDAVLYGLISTLGTSLVIDKIMYGMGAGTLAIVITEHGAAVAEKIAQITGRGSTAITAIGSYTKEKKDVLLCACSSKQAYIVKGIVHEVDKEAFVMLTETSEVFGEGFIEEKK